MAVGCPQADIYPPCSHHISLPVDTIERISPSCGASAERQEASEGPLPPVCLDWGHCIPWIQLIHSHPIVITLLCDWPNTVRTIITLNRWESWHKYIKEVLVGKIITLNASCSRHRPGLTGHHLTAYSPWGISTQRKLKWRKLICRRSDSSSAHFFSVNCVSLKDTHRNGGFWICKVIRDLILALIAIQGFDLEITLSCSPHFSFWEFCIHPSTMEVNFQCTDHTKICFSED